MCLYYITHSSASLILIQPVYRRSGEDYLDLPEQAAGQQEYPRAARYVAQRAHHSTSRVLYKRSVEGFCTVPMPPFSERVLRIFQ